MDIVPIGLAVATAASLAVNFWQRSRLKESAKKAKGYDTYIAKLVGELQDLKRDQASLEKAYSGLGHRERIANEKLDKINHLLNPLGTVCQGFLDDIDDFT